MATEAKAGVEEVVGAEVGMVPGTVSMASLLHNKSSPESIRRK